MNIINNIYAEFNNILKILSDFVLNFIKIFNMDTIYTNFRVIIELI